MQCLCVLSLKYYKDVQFKKVTQMSHLGYDLDQCYVRFHLQIQLFITTVSYTHIYYEHR